MSTPPLPLASPSDLALPISSRSSASASASSAAFTSPPFPFPDEGHASATLQVGGMTCGACVQSIESMLGKQPGILSVTVALLAERAVVKYETSQWSADKIAEEIEDIGFEAQVLSDDRIRPPTYKEDDSDYQKPTSRIDEVTISIYGMTCSACVAAIENGLQKEDGIISCQVSLATQKARIEYDSGTIGLRGIIDHIEEMGFDATIADDRDSTQLQSLGRVKEISEWRRAFLSSLAFAVPVFMTSMVLPKWPFARSILMSQPIPRLWLTDIVCLCLTAPVQFGVGRRFYRTAWKSIKHRSTTMDVLVVIGTTLSFTYSVVSMIGGIFCSGDQCNKPATFFDTSTMLITFVSLGRYLENTAKGKTSEALSRLIGLSPTYAVIYTDGEKCTTEKKIASELVQRGDYVKVTPGEKIPADGVVIRGSSSVDESVVTGESMPVSKQPGSPVIGGTVNGLGTFDFRVERAGKDTSLAQIVKLVSEAQTSKAPIQAFADRVAGIFVPTVIALGLLTLCCWLVVIHVVGPDSLPQLFQTQASKIAVCLKLCISVVVVACPCALGLATPTAVMVGTGVGAQNGILIKGGKPLEASVKVKKVLFDKTGTLTMGQVTVAKSAWIGSDSVETLEGLQCEGTTLIGLPRSSVLALIGTLENRSEHPLARAITRHAAEATGVPEQEFPVLGQTAVESFESKTAQGVVGRVRLALPSGAWSSHQISIGNASLVDPAQAGLSLQAGLQEFTTAETNAARTLVYVSIDSSLVCVLSLSDRVRPEAAAAIAALHNMGISTGLVTGDTLPTASAVAAQVGIPASEVYASIPAAGKSALVNSMKTSLALSHKGGANIAFVGDGINDSPALASCDVGIALSSGSDIALESASIVLIRNSLLDVPASLLLSRRIFFQIRLNFAWATAYNLVALPLAMGLGLPWGWSMHPMVAGAAMAASSVSVVGGSLTLRLWRRPRHLEGSVAPAWAKDAPTMGPLDIVKADETTIHTATTTATAKVSETVHAVSASASTLLPSGWRSLIPSPFRLKDSAAAQRGTQVEYEMVPSSEV